MLTLGVAPRPLVRRRLARMVRLHRAVGSWFVVASLVFRPVRHTLQMRRDRWCDGDSPAWCVFAGRWGVGLLLPAWFSARFDAPYQVGIMPVCRAVPGRSCSVRR
jgi:hypothetical protein